MAIARPGADGADAVEPFAGAEHLVGHIERQHGDGHSGLEHDVRCLWVNIDIELSRGSDVAALEISACHHHDAADAGGDVGRLEPGPGRDWS